MGPNSIWWYPNKKRISCEERDTQKGHHVDRDRDWHDAVISQRIPGATQS